MVVGQPSGPPRCEVSQECQEAAAVHAGAGGVCPREGNAHDEAKASVIQVTIQVRPRPKVPMSHTGTERSKTAAKSSAVCGAKSKVRVIYDKKRCQVMRFSLTRR